ncbi:MAG: hypothetical protein NXY57DRAFT_970134 [Lentinula lateritia]|nr:MAG: hypothetical protein NXY57DRAFT_970134 [Lentinula lateritia]
MPTCASTVQMKMTDYGYTTKKTSKSLDGSSQLNDPRFNLYKKRKLDYTCSRPQQQSSSYDDKSCCSSRSTESDFWWNAAENRECVLNQLLNFDRNPSFGPSVNLTRYERWKRAENLNLNPPCEVLAFSSNMLVY